MEKKTKRKRVIIALLSIIFISLLFFLMWWVWPIKKAVEIRPSSLEDGYFLCSRTAITGIDWELILEPSQARLESILGETTDELNIEYIALEGNSPLQSLKNSMGWSYTNKYLLKGRFLDKRVEIGNNEYMRVVWVDEWEIVYPIHREDFWGQFLPKGWLTSYDFNTLP